MGRNMAAPTQWLAYHTMGTPEAKSEVQVAIVTHHSHLGKTNSFHK